MAGTTVAELQVVVEADIGPLERGLRDANQSVTGFGSKLSGLGGVVASAFGGAALAGIAGFTAGVSASVAAATDFEKTMSAVKAVSGATAGEMEQLSALALQLGRDTSFSAAEAGKGLEELVKGGLSISDIMGGAAKATLDLAAAGGVSLPEAATIAANALAQFNLKGEDMSRVADLIAGAANASALDVSDFKFSLQAAGAVASTVGFSFDDLAQAIAVMGKAGITGSDAGTSLKTMMLSLQPNTDKAKNLMRDLGIITAEAGNRFFDAEGKVKSMAEVAQVLQEATAGLTEAQRLQALETIFGSDAIRAAAVLAKEGAAGFNEMATSMGKVTAASVGAERLNNLSGAFEQLKGSLETAAITLGMSLLPILTDLVRWATEGVNAIIPSLDGLGRSFANVVAMLTGDGERAQQAFQGLTSSLEQTFGPALAGQITATLQDIRSTIDTVMSAIATLTDQHGAEISAAWQFAWQTVLAEALTQTQQLLGVIRVFALAAKGDWQGVWEELTKISEREQEKQRAAAERNAELMLAAIDVYTGGALTRFQASVEETTDLLASGWDQAIEVVTDATRRVGDVVSRAWDAITATTRRATEETLRPIVAAWREAQEATDTVFRAIKNVLIAVWDTIYQSVIKPRLDAISAYFSEQWEAIRLVVETKVTAARDLIAAAWGAVQTKTTEVLNAVLTFVRDTVFEPIRSTVEAKISATRDLVVGAWQAISDRASAILSPVLTFVRDTIFEPIRATVDNAMYGQKGVYTQFEGAVRSVQGVVHGTLEAVRGAWERTWSAIRQAAESPQRAMEVLIDLVERLKRIMPSWLIPRSPTPFQIGLEGIIKAARGMDAAFGSMGSGLDMIRRIADLATSIGGADFGRAAAAISASETGGGRLLVERGGTGAVGPFQFDPGGELRNFARDLRVSMAEAARIAVAEPMRAALWALTGYLGEALKTGIGRGLSGAELAMFGSRYGQRPAGDNWKKAGEWFERLFPGYGDGGIAWTKRLAWVAEKEPELITPFSALRAGMVGARSSGPTETYRFVIQEPSGRTLEEWYVTGRELAIKRQRVPAGSA